MKKKFAPPTLEQVQHYNLSRRNGINAQTFLDYYEQVGWVCGKACKPMRSWEAAIRLWERNAKPVQQGNFVSKHTSREWAEQ